MKMSAEAPVEWPSEQAWQTWWREVALPMIGTDDGGRLAIDGSPLPLRRVAGQGLEPGARFEHAYPQVTVLHGVARVEPDTRLVAAFSIGGPPGSRPDVVLEADSVSRPRRASTTSTLRDLRWDATLDLGSATVLTAQGSLAWASGECTLSRRRGQLVAELTAAGRGVWRPVVGGLLSSAALAQGADGIQVPLERLASALTAIAQDPSAAGWQRWLAAQEPADQERAVQGAEAPRLESEQARFDELLGRIEHRLREIDRQVEAQPWYRSKGFGRWMTLWRSAEPLDLPLGDRLPWGLIADAAAREAARSRRPRGLGIRAALDQQRIQHRPTVATAPRPSPPEEDPVATYARVTDDLLDLRWLRSPISAMKRMDAFDRP